MVEMQETRMPRLLRPGFRFLTSLVVAGLAFRLSPWLPHIGSRIVFAWDSGVTILLALTATMIWRSGPNETLIRARKEEATNIVILLATILTVAGALVAITYGMPEGESMSHAQRVFYIGESVAGVILAWLLTHIMYSLHYAKLYYGEIEGDANGFRKGLAFPGDNDLVDYWDFVYYSFTIAMCFQTSDVTVTAPYMRRLTIFHAIVSYFFALAILGLLLNGFISNLT
jgi:uncharacterized membrane protein